MRNSNMAERSTNGTRWKHTTLAATSKKLRHGGFQMSSRTSAGSEGRYMTVAKTPLDTRLELPGWFVLLSIAHCDCKVFNSGTRYDTTRKSMGDGKLEPIRWTRVKTLEVMHCPTQPFSASLAHLVPAYRSQGAIINYNMTPGYGLLATNCRCLG